VRLGGFTFRSRTLSLLLRERFAFLRPLRTCLGFSSKLSGFGASALEPLLALLCPGKKEEGKDDDDRDDDHDDQPGFHDIPSIDWFPPEVLIPASGGMNPLDRMG
jgi:hypothetical protein